MMENGIIEGISVRDDDGLTTKDDEEEEREEQNCKCRCSSCSKNPGNPNNNIFVGRQK